MNTNISKTTNKISNLRTKQGIYTICFALLCVIDQLVITSESMVSRFAANSTYLILITLLLTGFQISEQKRLRVNWPFFILWCGMMIFMIFSKNEDLWPVWFLLLFGVFYLIDYTKEHIDRLMNGMMNGIIIGFLILQGFATMYRAYDTLAYHGMYTDEKTNALFYLFVHTAILGKWYQFHQKGALTCFKLLAAFGSGVLFVYCFLTLNKTAMYVMLLNTVFTLIFIALVEKQSKPLRTTLGLTFLRLLLVLLTAVLTFPTIFYSVRTIPAEFYSHVILYEEPEGQKIPSYAKVDDERYTDKEEILWEGKGQFLGYDDPQENEAKKELWMLRKGIYKAYLSKITFLGHSNEESDLWVIDWYHAIHTHNIFLQIFYTHGIICGILFFLDSLLVLTFLFLRCINSQKSDWRMVSGFLFTFSFLAFGCFERDWMLGQLPLVLFFLLHYLVLHRERKGDSPQRKPHRPSYSKHVRKEQAHGTNY